MNWIATQEEGGHPRHVEAGISNKVAHDSLLVVAGENNMLKHNSAR
jgi:hypothetical protein